MAGQDDEKRVADKPGGRSSWSFGNSFTPPILSLSDRSGVQPANIAIGDRLRDGERGAVWPIFPASCFPAPGEIVMGNMPVPYDDLRTALLFFDKFDIPSQPLIGGLEWCEPEFRSVGVLTSSEAKVGGDVAKILRLLPYQTFLARDAQEPGKWTLARPTQALGIPEAELRPSTAGALTLQNALPSFSREVPLEDVLEFKYRAWSELLALRAYLDDLCLEISRNGSNDLQQSAPFRRFSSALEAHARLMGQSNRERVWQSLKASFDLGAAASSGFQVLYTGSFNLGTIAAGAITIGVKTVAGLRRKRDASNPFEYLTSAHLDL